VFPQKLHAALDQISKRWLTNDGLSAALRGKKLQEFSA
jgi:hypothetical protein